MTPEQANRMTRILVNSTACVVVGVCCLIIWQAVIHGAQS